MLREQYTHRSRTLARLRYGLTWWKARRFTTRVLNQFDGCTVVSEQERVHLQEVVPGSPPIIVIPNGVDLEQHRGDFGTPQPDTLVFSGALTYYANLDGMRFFLDQVFPLVAQQRPNVILRITGRTDGVPIEQLPLNRNTLLTGYLDDIRPTVARSWLSVVPLHVGGGTRLKILEAMALGTPVVSTSKGAEGLRVTPGENILIADQPADYATAILRLLEDPALRTRLAAGGRKLVRDTYDWDQIGQQLSSFLTWITHR